MGLEIVDDLSFERILTQELPILVEFSANWCGPCVKMLPILEKLAEETANKLKIVKVDVDDSPGMVAKFGIRSVPSLILFHQGKEVARKVGLISLMDLKVHFLSQVGI